MALIKSFETSSGIECPSAYHIVNHVQTTKRANDNPDPDNMRPENSPDHAWKAGTYGRVSVIVYSSKEAREAGKQPIAAYAQYPTDVAGGDFPGEVIICQAETDMNFTIDLSPDALSIVDQAYAHLLTQPHWDGAVND
jgi:hypothetical protein